MKVAERLLINGCKAKRLLEHKFKDICTSRAQRHLNAELARALGDSLRQHSEDAQGGERQGENPENVHQNSIMRIGDSESAMTAFIPCSS